MRYILAFFLLAYSSVAIATGELGFTASDIQERRVQPPAAVPADPNIEAQLNVPDDPIPPPRLLPVDDPPQRPAVARPTVARPAVAHTLPLKQATTLQPRQAVRPQYAKLIRRKTMVASYNKRRARQQMGRAVATRKKPTSKKMASFKPKKVV